MLRNLQKSRILSFLNSNPYPWKVLILDKHTQSIISPLLKSKELRDCGITAYFLFSSYRQPIANTPALYFVSNISEISKDVLNSLYFEYNIHCVNSIQRKDLESLALTLSKKCVANQITQVYDQYVDFISLQDDLYTLDIPDSYYLKESREIWKSIVSSMLSIFVTLDSVPYIFSTDETTNTICKMIKDKMANNKLFDNKSHKRSLLIMVNRDYDVFTPIQHVWSYSALMDDLLTLENNKIVINNKTYDLDPSDPLWKDNRNEYFPLVVEKVEAALLEYKKEMALRSIDNKSDKKAITDLLDKTPELAKKNESVNSHITICLEMVDIIKKRNIDEFYRIEKTGYSDEELMTVSEKGTDQDILRLALSIINTKDGNVAEAMLKKRNIKTNVTEFFKKFRTKTTVEKSKFFNMVSSIMGNVQKFLPVKEKSPLSDLVENIWNNSKSDVFKMFDPLNVDTFRKENVSSIVVCMVGGATYSELKTLKNLEEKIGIPIIYGGTEILNSKKFLDQVEKLMRK